MFGEYYPDPEYIVHEIHRTLLRESREGGYRGAHLLHMYEGRFGV